jgi:hypothetical protein
MATAWLSGCMSMPRNPAVEGNGSTVLALHVGRPCRAVPERWHKYDALAPVT